MKYLFLTLFALAIWGDTYAQSKDDEARALFQKAQDAYDEGNYLNTEDILSKLQDGIGANPKILYLRVKAIKMGLGNGSFANTERNYDLTMSLINMFFAAVNKATYPAEKYSEMVSAKVDIQEKLNVYENARTVMKNQLLGKQRRERIFLRDTFDVYIQKFVKSFNDKNWAIFDPTASTVSGSDWLERSRNFIKDHPELAPFPHHLEYNSTTRNLYIYHYSPGDKNTDQAACCPDTIYMPVARWQLSPRLDGVTFTSRTDSRENPKTLKLSFTVPGKKISAKTYINFEPAELYKYDMTMHKYTLTGPLNDLSDLMNKTGFDEYFSTVFAFTTPDGKSFYRELGDGKWGEFAYPKREPTFNFKFVSNENGSLILLDESRGVYVRITGSECFFSRDKSNINSKLYDGSWIKGSQLF